MIGLVTAMPAFAAGTLRIILGEAPPVVFIAKIIGAFAGSLISIAYVLPRGRREAYLRLAVGVLTGLIFGSTVGVKTVDMLGLLGRIGPAEVTLMGAGVASLSAWWGLGALKRLTERWPASVSDPFKAPDKKETRP